MKRGEIQIRNWEEILYSTSSEALQQVAQRSCGCLILGSVKGQTDVAQSNLSSVQNLFHWCRGWNQMIFKVPSNQKHSMIFSLLTTPCHSNCFTQFLCSKITLCLSCNNCSAKDWFSVFPANPKPLHFNRRVQFNNAEFN